MFFQYDNGNLIKVTNDSYIFEVRYDDAPSFLTYSNNGYSTPWGGGTDLIHSSGFYKANNGLFPFRTMYRIPHFLTYKNNNNPIEYKLNGNIIHSFQYEYNPYGYPSKILSTNSEGTITEEIVTYVEID